MVRAGQGFPAEGLSPYISLKFGVVEEQHLEFRAQGLRLRALGLE
jgi:hypothetical protein